VPAAHQHHRIGRGHAIKLGGERQPLFLELGFVPVGIADDEIARLRLCGCRLDRRQEVGDRARRRKIDARAAALVVEMPVRQPRCDKPAAKVVSVLPTAMNFSPFTAKPCANPAPSRAVKTLPLTATMSADCPSAVRAAAHRSAMMLKVTIRWRTASSVGLVTKAA
jgi:hypothetical protein